MSGGQDEVFAFLASPAAWPGAPAHVDTIETHGARVFLAGSEVLKVKRAVKLPYLDFSTLAARRQYCEREITLNGGAASGIYRDVVAITRGADGHLAINGTGTPVEYAVRMARFDQDQLLSNVVARGALSQRLCDDLADAVFRYHRAAPAADASAERIAEVAANVLHGLHRHGAGSLGPVLSSFERSAADHVARTAALRSGRARKGHVRRCHGDLHLGNLVVWQGRPVLFDALEFDEALATTDTLYDLAFLLMDLDRSGARRQANAVLNRYLWRTGDVSDLEGLALLPLFMALRAAIRAMVALDRAALAGSASRQARSHAVETLQLAVRDLSPPPPRLIAVGGLSGTGKTTLARALAPSIGAAPGALHVRSDLERKALAGVEPEQRLPACAYTKESSAAVYARLLERVAAALSAGHAVVADAVFASPAERADAEDIARRAGVPFQGFWLEGGVETMKQRVAARSGDASDATPAVVEAQLDYRLGDIAWTRIDAGQSADATLSAVRLGLGLEASRGLEL